MSKKIKLDKEHYHEMLDRLHLILCNVEDFLLDHPVSHKEKKIRKKVEKASKLLSDVYREMGKLEFDKFYK